ncbi:1-(5-phosphoribosyl)-5-[(5-phosphoribosylamino)methylideneamino] imidazole-4-carboxamide isomerase [Trametes pubescens]|uniref:1-(5-phosphoribosyl)-5-[(5-phosphoribosylamino)methylideneamino] imidazole-4-carboxamide isomerase n=1 Tax=Trametes pubescens TaxID=154538 RepID=A0A1M2VRF6_TRAPU|nr:1-(5-phosphoribosyl)-5-[(5-phosphoribosylamino)methylideneamino] imidazole-4-carboxamide isomerase [Trametes pubescens]
MAHRQRRSLFRPCIDLHNGEVKQIVGGTLHEDDASRLQTNFVARRHLQIGGGITVDNAQEWLDAGASKV